MHLIWLIKPLIIKEDKTSLQIIFNIIYLEIYLADRCKQQKCCTCYSIELNTSRYPSIALKTQIVSFNASLNTMETLYYRELLVTCVAEVIADLQIIRRRFFSTPYLLNNGAEGSQKRTANNRKTKDISNANRPEIFTFVFNRHGHFPTLRRRQPAAENLLPRCTRACSAADDYIRQ